MIMVETCKNNNLTKHLKKRDISAGYRTIQSDEKIIGGEINYREDVARQNEESRNDGEDLKHLPDEVRYHIRGVMIHACGQQGQRRRPDDVHDARPQKGTHSLGDIVEYVDRQQGDVDEQRGLRRLHLSEPRLHRCRQRALEREEDGAAQQGPD